MLAEAGIPVRPVAIRDYGETCMHLYVVRVRAEERDPLIAHLADMGIAAMIHYPIPVHLSTAYAFLGLREGSYPEAERMAREIITLPMYAELTDEQARMVVEALRAFYGGDQG
jgi:dTDP-4-amino-4,6-dideoxygalactose transaminase